MNTKFGEFVNAVAAMRAAQKAFFKTRMREHLLASIEGEREVDALIAEIREQIEDEGAAG